MGGERGGLRRARGAAEGKLKVEAGEGAGERAAEGAGEGELQVEAAEGAGEVRCGRGEAGEVCCRPEGRGTGLERHQWPVWLN